MKIQAAPGAPRCCDAAGRMALLCWQPVALERLHLLAMRAAKGTREEIAARVRDMIACGMLIELEEP